MGCAVISELQAANIPFLALTHGEATAESLIASGVKAKAVDVMDTGTLRSIFREARRAFLLNPPADPKSDTDSVERATATSITEAVDGSGLEKVVVASTYGAQPGERIGDLSVLFGFERLIEQTGIPAAINRGAYYFTNLEPLLEAARKGTITTPFPEDLLMPMVSPIDLGKQVTLRLLSPTSDVGIRYVEGPDRYTFLDVVAAFSGALGHAVLLEKIPNGEIEASYKELGFSDAAAVAFARMTKASIEGMELPDDPVRGDVGLFEYLRELATPAEASGNSTTIY
ncbi:NmrA family NAD(P)-binding protein [Rhizobium sp. S96]|uniref:NmrA family NAD(P)-binding protein n=1 Tax=Rhizobium sp. S96 TaxID=3055140 RepID=UPI0025AA91FD|nr:NmrA family NAD(P)-binding protein [Rhizobium sp. S96]MDM9621111.1 NmrA family NAD(P)-binding protein [Rhizobium sp. S96]